MSRFKRWGVALLFALLAVYLAAAPARADWDLGGKTDEQYVSDYFGTTLLMVTDKQLVDPNADYWSNKLPAEFNNNPDYLVGLINAGRMSKKQPLLDAAAYPIVLGWETPLDGGKFQYHIDFTGIRPSEVAAVIQALGGEAKVLPGAAFSVKPLQSGYFSGTGAGTTKVTLMLGSQELNIDVAQPIASVQKTIADLLKKRFGADVMFTLSLSQDYNYDNAGTSNSNVYLTVNLEGAQAEGMPEGE